MSSAKVLILMTSPLDKIVHALRVVESIKRHRPDLEMTWVVRRFYEPLVASFDFVDRTIVFRRGEALASFAGLVREIRRDRYDFVLDLEGYARTGAMCFFAKGGRKIGLRSAREGAAVCYSEVIAKTADERRHLLERFQGFGLIFGLKAEPRERLPLPLEARLPEPVERLLAAGRTLVCLFPGRFKSHRAWGGMLELASRLVDSRSDAEVLVLGVVPFVLGRPIPERVHDFQERFTWAEISAVVAKAALVVSNDNGFAHLAAALGAPNLTLYTYVSPEVRGAYPVGAARNAVLRVPRADVSLLECEAVFGQAEKLLAL